MPPTIGHLPLLRKRKWEMVYFFLSLHPIDSYCSGGAWVHRARRLSSKRANTASSRALDPPHAGEGREVGGRRKNPPAFGEKSPCFGTKPPFCRRKGRKTVENAFFFRVNLVNCGRCRTFAIANGKQARWHNERPQRNTPSLMIKQVDRMCNGEVAELVDALL